MDNTLIKIHVQVLWRHVFSTLENISKSRSLKLSGNSIFNFLRNNQLVFHIATPFTILQSQWYCMRVSISQLSYQHLLSVFCFRHPRQCKVVSHCNFDLHFSDGQSCWACFHELIWCSYIFWNKCLFKYSAVLNDVNIFIIKL